MDYYYLNVIFFTAKLLLISELSLMKFEIGKCGPI